MKKIITSFLIVATIGLFAGCASQSANSTAVEQIAITTAAAVGVEADLQKNPSDRAYFVDGATLLSELSGGTNQLTVEDVQSALAASGQNSPYAQLIAPLVINILNADLQNNGTNSMISNNQVKQAVGWVATGIMQGVNATPVPAIVAPVPVEVVPAPVIKQ